MVAGGIPIPTEDHAERVAKTALCLRYLASFVESPITSDPIKVPGFLE